MGWGFPIFGERGIDKAAQPKRRNVGSTESTAEHVVAVGKRGECDVKYRLADLVPVVRQEGRRTWPSRLGRFNIPSARIVPRRAVKNVAIATQITANPRWPDRVLLLDRIERYGEAWIASA